MPAVNHLESAVNTVLRTIINTAMGDMNFAIRARQKNAPRPTTPHATVGAIQDVEVSMAETVVENIETAPDIIDVAISKEVLRQFDYSINFFFENAFDNAHKTRTALHSDSIQKILNDGGLGFIQASTIRDVSEALENGWEERANLDISLYATGSHTDIVHGINCIEVNLIAEMGKRQHILQLGVNE